MSNHMIGILGFGRIGQALYDYILADEGFELEYAYVRSERDNLPREKQLFDISELTQRDVELCIEAATHEVLADLGEAVLEVSDLLVLSGSAFADDATKEQIESAAMKHGTAVYLPHAALLGIDGLVDARPALHRVEIEATKAPSHLDFSYTETFSSEEITGRTVLYDGPVRGLCRHFPRNFNSHAAVALAGVGLEKTQTTLVADPEIDVANHVITAVGDGFDLKIVRSSDIEGVTGDYTLFSIWGSIRRILDADEGLKLV